MKPFRIKRKNPKAIEDLIENTVRLAHKKVEIGFPNADEMHDEAGMTIKKLAAIHEFGTIDGKIPARPFIQPTMDQNRDKYRKMLFKSAGPLLLRRTSIENVLKTIGKQGVEDMQNLILKNDFTPIADMTAAKKGHTMALLDTHQMYDAIDYEVK